MAESTDRTAEPDLYAGLAAPADMGPWIRRRIVQVHRTPWALARDAEAHRVAAYGTQGRPIYEDNIRRRVQQGYTNHPQGPTIAELRSVLLALDASYEEVAARIGYPTAFRLARLAHGPFPDFLNTARLHRGLSYNALSSRMERGPQGLTELLRGSRVPTTAEWDEHTNVLELDFATSETVRHRFGMTSTTTVESHEPVHGDAYSRDSPREPWGIGNYSRTRVLRAHEAQRARAVSPTPSSRSGASARRPTPPR